MGFKSRKAAFQSTEKYTLNIKTEKHSAALEVKNGGTLTKLLGNFHNRYTGNADLMTTSCHELYLSYTASLTWHCFNGFESHVLIRLNSRKLIGICLPLNFSFCFLFSHKTIISGIFINTFARTATRVQLMVWGQKNVCPWFPWSMHTAHYRIV